jgi:hypothetical protein
MKTPIPLFLVISSLTCFSFLPEAQAVSPPPDGGYPGGNTAEGTSALGSLTTGLYNTAVGIYSLLSLTDGDFNTGVGAGTLLVNTGDGNTATGAGALLSNTTGTENAAVGTFSLFDNTTGSFNTAIGSRVLVSNTTGTENTASGTFALSANTEGSFNTAFGAFALANNTGSENTAVGVDVLFNNTAGGNTGIGTHALRQNTTGFQNTALGDSALTTNEEGSFNTALGQSALVLNTGDGNTACGNVALFNNTGNNNTALGNVAGTNLTTGDNNIDIGNQGVAAEANTIRIGTMGTQTATYIAGITGKITPRGIPVVINANGQLGTVVSSARFKDGIKPMDKASEAILALKPVTFRYKKEIDPDRTPQFGLVAEEVAKVNPDLVVRDADGNAYTVRYEAVNAMLLNEFLKEHRTVQELKKEIAALTVTVKKQAAQIQKVSTQLEMSKPAPQMAMDNH